MKRILIVEDNADLRDLLSIVIRRLGYDVGVAKTGEEAVARARAMNPNLILMDVGLPKFNGFEATIRIKADPRIKHIPVVILSALPMCSHGTLGYNAGAVEVMQKPISITDVEQVLTKYVCKKPKVVNQPTEYSVNTRRFLQISSMLH